MYTPNQEILKKYADVLVNFALRSGKGIKKGDVVFVYIPECAKPFLIPLQESILKAGGHPVIRYLPDGTSRHFYENASMEQIKFMPKEFKEGEIKSKTHHIGILAEADKHELDGIDPKKIMTRIKVNQPFRDLIDKKERDKKFSWTICLYGTPAMAKEVNMSLEEYRKQIIDACYLNEKNPVKKRQEINKLIIDKKNKLDKLKIEKIHIKGKDVDLHIKIGKDRCRRAGSGCNIPSFEIFTSPDYREVNGRIKFNQPLYRYGSLIKGIEIEFKNGKISKAKAKQNDKLFQDMIKIPGMNQLGEFSLTDARTSKITKFMGETLYDENVGGKYGNTHIALGRAFDECYIGDKSKLDDTKFKKSIGLNSSAEHVDIISTTDRTVTATLQDGTQKIIYQNGQFTI
ncbi:MAG TPA: aminopeptidase [Candidatus Absconditabacterales bacterium]|nr:aminopeptidase [Candidatus Absconditabacterales bacterium]